MTYYGLTDTFHLISRSVGYITPDDLVEACRSIGMLEQSFFDLPSPSNFPTYDAGYFFKYITDNNINATVEILEKDNKILQAGTLMAYPPSLFFSKVKNHYGKLQELIETYYGVGTSTTLRKVEILNFGDSKTVCYLSKGVANKHEYVSFKIGDRIFWG